MMKKHSGQLNEPFLYAQFISLMELYKQEKEGYEKGICFCCELISSNRDAPGPKPLFRQREIDHL